jgi:excinuclease UvrABC ATPase subunit
MIETDSAADKLAEDTAAVLMGHERCPRCKGIGVVVSLPAIPPKMSRCTACYGRRWINPRTVWGRLDD